MHIDIGITVYNEENNIVKLLRSLTNQRLRDVEIDKVFVVSSGSTDKTNVLVTDYRKIDNRVHLIAQDKREGKPAAINEFLRNSTKEIVVVTSGDIIFHKNAIERLTAPFIDETVGMASVYPVPTNENDDFMGFVAVMHWELHNILERHGESIAFRKDLVKHIPITVVADEAYIEVTVQRKKLKVVHVKDAIVFNKGPETPREFLKQISRHFLGHLQLEFKLHYSVSSMTTKGIISVLRELTVLSIKKPSKLPYCFGYLYLEILGRMMGTFDFVLGNKNPVMWDIAQSTKSLNKVIGASFKTEVVASAANSI